MISTPSPEFEKSLYKFLVYFSVLGNIFNPERVNDQLYILRQYVGILERKRILEVGSGFGAFTLYARKFHYLDVIGIEPGVDEFSDSLNISRSFAEELGIDPNVIVQGTGENIPFPDNAFDVIYSSNVLEHVQNPQKVFKESLRVLKPGGYLQFVIPSYGSLWEGHYNLPWIPYLPKRFAKIYVSLFRRDPSFIDTLQFNNYFSIQRILVSFSDQVEIIDLGMCVFQERLKNARFGEWAGLSKLRPLVQIVHTLKLAKPLSRFLLFLKMYNPIIITLKKKESHS